jgi:hypothetical protein
MKQVVNAELQRRPQNASLRVLPAGAQDAAEWDSYLRSKSNIAPQASFGWGEVLRNCYGAEPLRLMAKDANRIRGVLFGYSPLPNEKLYSVPIVADNPEIGRALLDAARNIATERGILRSMISSGVVPIDTPYYQWTKTTVGRLLPGSEQEAWKSLRKKTRYTIRQAMASNIVVEQNRDRLDEFYAVYVARMSEKNVPFHSRAFLEQMMSTLGDDILFLVALKDKRVLGGMTFIVGRDAAMYQLNAAFSDAMPPGVNYLLMWEAMRALIAHGVHHLDLGESTPGGGVYAFKTVQFGGFARDVFYYDVTREAGAKAIDQPYTTVPHKLMHWAMRAAPAPWRSHWLLSQIPFGRLL